MTAALIIFAICCGNGQGTGAETDKKADLVLAYSLHGLANVDRRDATAALKIYTTELASSVRRTVDSYLYDNLETVTEDIRKGKADLIELSAMDYLRIKNRIDLELALCHVKGGKKNFKYLFLTRQNKGYAHLEDLRKKKILLSKGDDSAKLYLQLLLLRQKLGEVQTFFSSVDEKSKTSQVVLPVFFGQADACIVTDVSFKTMVEMNPQLGKELQVIASSPDLTTSVTVFRKALAGDIKEKALAVGKSLKNNSRGRQMLMLFKIEDLIPVYESDLESIKQLVGEYNQLRSVKK